MKPALPLLISSLILSGCIPSPPPEDPDRFVLLGADGHPAATAEHHCVFDSATQLTWAVPRANDPLHDPAHRYTWYSAYRAEHLGEPGEREGGSCALEECSTAALIEAVNAAGLCGHDDWRLPSREEAILLGKRHGDIAFGMHPRLFPDAKATEVWTITTFRLYPQSAWAYDTGNALDRADLKAEAKGARLVRGTMVLPKRK